NARDVDAAQHGRFLGIVERRQPRRRAPLGEPEAHPGDVDALAEARPHPLDHGPLAAEPELSALCEVRRVPKPEDVAPGAKPASARELEAQRALLAPEEGGRNGSGDPVAHHGDRLRAGQRLEVPLHAIELERLERAAANPELDRVLYRRTPV